MLLPSQFWVPQGSPPWCGGVERALMSTTADMAVALHYANGKGTVVEIDVGRIQTGGDVSFLSMVRARPPFVTAPLAPAAIYSSFFSFRLSMGYYLIHHAAAVSGGEGDHVPPIHLPRVARRPPPGADQGRRTHHLPPQGPIPTLSDLLSPADHLSNRFIADK
jgi:hypothetical protein